MSPSDSLLFDDPCQVRVFCNTLWLRVSPIASPILEAASIAVATNNGDDVFVDINTFVLSIRGVSSVEFPTGVMERLWSGQGLYGREVVLCSGLVDDGRDHRRYMEPRFVITSQYLTSWAYTRNRQPHQHSHTTELLGSTKIPSRGFPNTSLENQTSYYVRVIYTACCCSASILTFHAFIPPYPSSGYVRLTKYPNLFI